jgi:hypothetical protein
MTAMSMTAEHPTANGSGPPPGNLNAAKNGSRLRRFYRLPIGTISKPLEGPYGDACDLRRKLEEAVNGDGNDKPQGVESVTAAHLIDEAAGWEMHRAVCCWLLRHRIDKMSPGDILACSREIARARVARNAAVGKLGLDAEDDEFSAYDAALAASRQRAASDGSEDAGTRQNADAARGDRASDLGETSPRKEVCHA